MSVAVRLLQIPIISRIPDSTSRITGSKSQDFAFHKQIVSSIPVSELPYMEETTAISKQTKTIPSYGARSISHYQAISVLTRRSKNDSENIDVLLLVNAERQKRNNEMPKGTRMGKTEPGIAFR